MTIGSEQIAETPGHNHHGSAIRFPPIRTGREDVLCTVKLDSGVRDTDSDGPLDVVLRLCGPCCDQGESLSVGSREEPHLPHEQRLSTDQDDVTCSAHFKLWNATSPSVLKHTISDAQPIYSDTDMGSTYSDDIPLCLCYLNLNY